MARYLRVGEQFFDDAGDPLNGGKLYFVESGAAIDPGNYKNTYSDADETIANTNPIVLGADGRSSVDIWFSGAAKIQLTDSLDVQLDVKDPVPALPSAGDAFSNWNGLITYEASDIVIGSDGEYYTSIGTSNLNNDPTSTSGFWEKIYFVGNYEATQTYGSGQLVIDPADNNLYLSLANDNIGNTPNTTPASWKVLTAAGNVTGPGSSTDNAVVRFNGTGGTAIQNSVWVINDTGALGATDSTNESIMTLTTSASTANAIFVNAPALTTGIGFLMYSDSADASARAIAYIANDNAAADSAVVLTLQQDGDTTAFGIDQNGNGLAISIDSDATTEDVINIAAGTTTGTSIDVISSALTSGRSGRFYSNSADTGTRNVLEVHNDNTAATGATAFCVAQDSDVRAVHIDQNGNGLAIDLYSDATTANVIDISASALTSATIISIEDADSLNVGKIMHLKSNSSSTSGRELVTIHNDNAAATGTTVLELIQDSLQPALEIVMNGAGTAIDIDGTGITSGRGVYITANSLTSGGAIRIESNSSDATSRSVIYASNTHSSASGAIVLSLRQDAPANSIFVDHHANSVALHIDSESTTAASVFLQATTSNVVMHIENSESSNPNGMLIDFNGGAPNNGTQYFVFCEDASAARFAVYSNGGISNYQSNDVDLSDEKMKTELIPIGSAKESIMALEICRSSYLDSPEKEMICVGANQAALADNDFSADWNEDTKGVINKHIMLKAVKLLQETVTELDDMKLELAALKPTKH